MKKVSIVFLICSLLSTSIYTSDWSPDDVGSESTVSNSSSAYPIQRSPSVNQLFPMSGQNRVRSEKQLRIKIRTQHLKSSLELYKKISEVKSILTCILLEFCPRDLAFVLNATLTAGLPFYPKKAIEKSKAASYRLTNEAFTCYAKHQKRK